MATTCPPNAFTPAAVVDPNAPTPVTAAVPSVVTPPVTAPHVLFSSAPAAPGALSPSNTGFEPSAGMAKSASRVSASVGRSNFTAARPTHAPMSRAAHSSSATRAPGS